MWPDLRKPTMYMQQVKCILLLIDKYQEVARFAFPQGFFLVIWNTEKPVQMVRDLWEL